ncbi:sensor histidine kinase [Coraliomargarita sp. SDUM461004]|uniref:histidine kinase n=1 Tax=Thalassobacterium sedimentorum TaxID=3041258 RepID=A0ABU1AGE4_9BACT|nr:sensor histidine kinase [Coraliomargarita sp. SDUM461004]MDQ8193858.1 sensor histidine kinase [Coraliomargarita sp. SDUM461004]
MRISSKLRWFVVLLVVLTSLSIALVGYWGSTKIISDFQMETLKKRSQFEVSRLQLAFSELNHDIDFISNLPMVDHLANADGMSQLAVDRELDDLTTIFEQMLSAKPYYSQIRLIPEANNGLESVRVNQQDGMIYRVPRAELQEKGQRDYFLRAKERKAGELFHSEINLNREHGELEVPHRPMLRVAMPIYDRMEIFFGIVVINLDFEGFIEQLFGNGLDRSRYDYYVLNQDGYFLLHPNSDYTFGFDRGLEYQADQFFSQLKGFVDDEGQSRTFRLDSLPGASSGLAHFTKFRVFNPEREITIGLIGSYDDIGRASAFTIAAIIIAMLLLTALAMFVAIRFSFGITQPLDRISLATKHFQKFQEIAHDLPIERDDEVGALAKTFVDMQLSIEKHQSRLQLANQRLLEMNRDLEHFARVASHDLREPIQRIAGLASLYQTEVTPEASESAKEVLEQLHSECEKAMRLIVDFREFTDITHEGKLHRESCDPRDLIQSVLDEYKPALVNRKVEIEVEPHPAPMFLYKSLVRVLYRNLVDNALKHVKMDGFSLKFSCEATVDGGVCFSVMNSGSSLSPNQALEAFDIFSKIEAGSLSHGMGLTICKRIANFHGGNIWIESDETNVHVRFHLGIVETNANN